MLASSGVGVKLWNLENLQLVKEYPIIGARSGQLAYIYNFSVKPDSTQIASVVDSDSINLLSLETQIQYDLPNSIDTKCLSYNTSGSNLATGNSNGFIEIYDIKSNNLKKKSWKVQSSKCVNCLSGSKNERFIAIGSSNGSVSLFNTVTSTMHKPWSVPNVNGSTVAPMVTDIQYSMVNPNLAAAYDDGSVILWDPTKEQPICTFKAHNAPCTSITLSPLNFILMVSGGLDSMYTMYDSNVKKVIRQVKCPGGITSLDMAKNGWNLAAGTTDGSIHMYDLRSTDAPYMSVKAHDTSVFCVKFISQPFPSASSNNKENMKYLTSTMNSSNGSGRSGNSGNENSMKRSNSYNNQELANIANSPIYNIYSPESNKASFSSQSQVSLNSQNQFSGSGESFILHRKQTSTYNINTASTSSNPSYTNTSTNSQTLQVAAPPPNGTNIEYQRQNFKPKPRTNELFSPLLSTLPNPLQSKPLSKSSDQPITSSTISLAQIPGSKTHCKTPTPNNSNMNLSKNIKQDGMVITPINNYDQQSRPINRAVDFDMEVDQTCIAASVEIKAGEVHAREKMTTGNLEGIKEFVKDEIDDFRDDLMSENFRFKAEMLKEFMQLKVDMKKYFEMHSPNEALINENARLREENKRLKNLF